MLCLKIFCNFRMSPNFCMRSFCLIFFVYFVKILVEEKELSEVHTLGSQ